MIELVPFKAEHMIDLLSIGVIECGVRARGDVVNRVAEERELEGKSQTGKDGDQILGCYGVDELWPGVGEFWAMFSPSIKGRSVEACRLIKSEVESLSKDFNRVQCHIRNDFYPSLRMIQWLDFEEECLCRKYTQDGVDCYQYSKVK